MRSCTLYCACTNQAQRKDGTLDPRFHHRIEDVYFCPSCQTVRCEFCTVRSVASKFCSSCLSDYSDTVESYCVKNCFTCPQCQSMLAISVSDAKKDGLSGKKFTFTCVCCQYNYASDVIVKPKSILAIIKGEHHQHDSLALEFDSVRSAYSAMMNFELISNKIIKDIKRGQKYHGMQLARETITRLKDMNVGGAESAFINDYDKLRMRLEDARPIPLGPDQTELCDSRKACKTLSRSGVANFCFDVFNSFKAMNSQTSFPVPKRLTPRYSHKCIQCNHVLVEPPEELLSTRFPVKWNANEFVPEVTIGPRVNEKRPTTLLSNASYNFLVNIINPLPTSVQVTLSTPNIIHSSGVTVEAALSASNVVLGPFNPRDHTIKSIPTAYLTKETKMSRAELIMRLGKSASQKSNDEAIVEQSDNWCSVPMHVAVKASKKTAIDLKIPIHLSLQASLPPAIQELKLSKPNLVYRVWTIGALNGLIIEPQNVDHSE